MSGISFLALVEPVKIAKLQVVNFLLSAVSLHSYHLLCMYVLIKQNIANYVATCMIAYVVT